MDARLEERIKPIVRNRICVPESGVSFSAACFSGEDWSLKSLYEPGDVHKNPELARRVGGALADLNAHNVYAPTPTAFNAQLALRSELTTILRLGEGVFLYRNKERPADGTLLSSPHEGFVFSAGGCGLIVASLRQDLVVAHAGRESVLDRRWVMSRGIERSRPRDLAENILISLGCYFGDVRHVHVWPLYFIRPSEFLHRKDDPLHGPYNRAACWFLPGRFGEHAGIVEENAIGINLPRILQQQFVELGVPEGNIHLSHAYLHKDLPHTRKGGGRYLVAAVRES